MDKLDLENMLVRIQKLEQVVFNNTKEVEAKGSLSKPITLPELARNNLLKNGQQKITVIVGYNEKILNGNPLAMPDIKELWKKGKFVGKCDPKLLERAMIKGLVREPEDNLYDLGQKGEDYFNEVINAIENPAGAKE